MTLEDVLQELIQRLGSRDDDTLAWEQIREWPKGTIEVFEKVGWIKRTVAASTVECPGCEDSCFTPVHVLPATHGKPARAYVACDRRDDMGRRQWQVTESQVARWVSGALSLKGKPEHEKTSGTYKLGDLQGNKRVGSLEFDNGKSVSLKSSGHSLPLIQVVYFEGDHPCIDRAAILDLVDLPPTSEFSAGY